MDQFGLNMNFLGFKQISAINLILKSIYNYFIVISLIPGLRNHFCKAQGLWCKTS